MKQSIVTMSIKRKDQCDKTTKVLSNACVFLTFLNQFDQLESMYKDALIT